MKVRSILPLLLVGGVAIALAQQSSTSTSQSQSGSGTATSSASGRSSGSGSASSQGGGSGSANAFRARPTHAVIWVPGDQWVEGRSTQEQPKFKEHLDYLTLLLRQGKNIMSGPWRDEPGGLTLLRAATDEEADALIANDPMVKAGVLGAEVKAWTVIMESNSVPAARIGK